MYILAIAERLGLARCHVTRMLLARICVMKGDVTRMLLASVFIENCLPELEKGFLIPRFGWIGPIFVRFLSVSYFLLFFGKISFHFLFFLFLLSDFCEKQWERARISRILAK